MKNDPLNKLFVTSEQALEKQRAQLAKLLSPFVTIDGETGIVYFEQDAKRLNAKQKILVYLLARLALAARSDSKFVSAARPIEVTGAVALPGGTVRPRLMELVSEHKISVIEGGQYEATFHLLSRAEEELKPVLATQTGMLATSQNSLEGDPMSIQFSDDPTWEEYAASLARTTPDTDRLLHVLRFRQEHERAESTDTAQIKALYNRAHWKHPSNLAATANYCARRGWLSVAGIVSRRKLWKITRTGYGRTLTNLEVTPTGRIEGNKK